MLRNEPEIADVEECLKLYVCVSVGGGVLIVRTFITVLSPLN